MGESLKGKLIVGVVVAAVAMCLYFAVRSLGGDALVKNTNTVTLMCSETGKLVGVELTVDMAPYPHENTSTGKRTLYPTEVCYKNECLQRGGTHVILNHWLGVKEPTRCPVCSAGVRAHNPGPERPAEDLEGIERG